MKIIIVNNPQWYLVLRRMALFHTQSEPNSH